MDGQTTALRNLINNTIIDIACNRNIDSNLKRIKVYLENEVKLFPETVKMLKDIQYSFKSQGHRSKYAKGMENHNRLWNLVKEANIQWPINL